MWILPVLGLIAALGAVRILHGIETAMGWESSFDPSTTLTLLGTLASSLFTLIVFVCSALLITVQLASAQLTPRIVGFVLQNRFTKLSLTLFVFTFTFTLAALVRIKGGVPPLTAYVAVYSCLVSLGVFFYLVDRVCAALRPSGALRSVARLGREVIQDVYPRRLSESQGATPLSAKATNEKPRSTVPNLREGVVLAFDVEGLVSLGRRANCVIEMVPQVGISWRPTSLCSESSAMEHRHQRRCFTNRWPWVPNGPCGKTRPLPSGSWWTSPRRAFPRRSTTRPPRFWPLIRFNTCSDTLAAASWIRGVYQMRRARFGYSTERTTGRTSFTWRSRRYVNLAARAFRWPVGCGPCWKA